MKLIKEFFKQIKKNFQRIFKFFSYKVFLAFHGSIKGKILASKDSKIKIQQVIKDKSFTYKIYFVKNARLYTDRVQDTAVILENYIVEGPSHQLRPINNSKIENNIVFKKGTPRAIKKLNGTVLSLLTGGAGNENYSHWLFDVLPRIGICENIVCKENINFFLFPNLDKKFQKETIDILKIDKKKILSSKKFRHISCEQLIVTDHPYCINNDATKDITNIPSWIIKWLRDQFLPKKENNDYNPSRFYIDRSDAEINKEQTRKIINEDEVLNFLTNKGFQKVKLEKLSFLEQVKLFCNAKIVVGLHGAGLANLVFCNSNTKIIEFKNNEKVKQYENLAKKNNLHYRSIINKPLKFNFNNQQGHIKVNIEELNHVLNKN